MVWTLETSCGFESDKIAALVVPYTRGRGVDIGCGPRRVWPHALGIDNFHHTKEFGTPCAANITGDGTELSMFADEGLDFVFSSHTLEHFKEERVPAILKEWARALKPGGFLILYVPSSNLYPKVGQPGANSDHKWDIYPGDIERKLQAATACGWTQVECEERAETNEYSLFEVYQKRSDGVFEKQPFERNPGGQKRCMVIRYGAIGDQLIASSVLPGLKKQGYHITYQTTPRGKEIIEHDPNVDAWWIQDTDQVPNEQLGSYWRSLEICGRFDRIVNLCESMEGALLPIPGRIPYHHSHEARHRLFNKNYLEMAHDIAAVPYKFAQKFHPTEKEAADSATARASIPGPLVVWALNGSSLHKVYPWVDVVIAWLVEKTPAHVYLLADPDTGVKLQDAILTCMARDGRDTSRVKGIAGQLDIRQTLTFAQQADVVIGPETGILNAVALDEDIPKVILLSHSSEENLTKHWNNTQSLTPTKEACPCYPCHRMHYDWSFCHKVPETGAALCASSIKPEQVFKAVMRALEKRAAFVSNKAGKKAA